MHMGTVEDDGCIWEQWKMVGAYGNSGRGWVHMGTVEDDGCIWEQWKMVGAHGNSEKGIIIILVRNGGVITKNNVHGIA